MSRVRYLYATPKRLLGDREMVTFGIVAVKRQSKSTFSSERAMTSAGIATEFGKNGQNMTGKFRRFRR
jgi:hypothetical protein